MVNGPTTADVTVNYYMPWDGSPESPCTATIERLYEPLELTGEEGSDQPFTRYPGEQKGMYDSGYCLFTTEEEGLRAGLWRITMEGPPLTRYQEVELKNGPNNVLFVIVVD